MRIYYGVRERRTVEVLESADSIRRGFPEFEGEMADAGTGFSESDQEDSPEPVGEMVGPEASENEQGSFTERTGKPETRSTVEPGMELSEAGRGDSPKSAGEAGKRKESEKPPLTVREGRSWLSREFEGREIKIKDLPDEEVYEDPEDPAVELKEVWFRYGKDLPDVLKGVSLKIPKGKLSAVVGGNGTGKSTMLKAVCDICRPYRGKILVDGKRVDKYKSAELFNGNLAMLPQDPQSLFVKKTVLEDLQEMLAERVKDKAERERLIASVSTRWFLSGAISGFVSNFLFGQGPLTPWQMFAYGMGGFVIGLLYRLGLLKRRPVPLAIAGAVCVLVVVGPFLDTGSLLVMAAEVTKESAAAIYLSGLPVNVIHATATALTLLLVSDPMFEKLDRIRIKYGMMEAKR